MRSIRAAFRKANAELSSMTRGTKEYNDQVKKIRQLSAIMDEHRGKLRGVNKQWENFKSIFLGTFAGNVAQSLIQRAFSSIPNLARGAAKVSDELAGIQKTANLTTEEVEALNRELGKIDTRSSRSDLRGIAERAGQAGIVKEDLFGYVEALDKVNVALGKDFGGAEEVATNLGNIRNVLTDIKTDNPGDDVLYISNAINKLSAEGNATAPVISNLTNRIGGLGIPLGLSSGQVLGMSAALQELNVSAERGGTATTKILQTMAREPEKFAKIARVSTADFKRLVNENIFEALLLVSEGSQQSTEGATEFASILEELQLTGSGASEVFSKIGSNTEFLREKVASATVALTDQNSILQEFTLNNENLAGKLDKLSKEFRALFTSAKVKEWFEDGVDLAREFVVWIKENGDEIKIFLKILTRAGGVWLLYRGYIAATNSAMALNAVRLGQMVKMGYAANRTFLNLTKTQAATRVATSLLTGSFKALRASWNAFIVSTGPFGLIAKGIGLIASALLTVLPLMDLFEKKTKKVVSTAQILADAENLTPKIDQAAMDKAKSLLSTLTHTNTQRADGIKLLKEFNDLTGQNVKWTDNQVQLVTDLSKAYKEYQKQLKNDADVRAFEDKITELQKIEGNLRQRASQVLGEILSGRRVGAGAGRFYDRLIDEADKFKSKIESLQVAKAFKENEIATANAVENATEETRNKIAESAKALDDLQKKLIASLNTFNEDFSKILAKAQEENKGADRDKKIAGLSGFDLDVEKLRDQFRDLRALTNEQFNESIKNARIQREELFAINDKLLEDQIISRTQHAQEKKSIEEAFIAWENRAIEAHNEALYNLRSAQLTKTELLREQYRKQYIEDELEAISLLNEKEEELTRYRLSRTEQVNQAYRKQQASLRALAEKLLLLENPDIQFISEDDIQAKMDELQQELDQQTLFIKLQAIVQDVNDIYAPAMDAATAYYDFMAAKEENKLRQIEFNANAEMLILEKKLKSNQITQEKYDAERLKIEQKQRLEEQKILIKQWRRDKALKYGQAIISTALGVTNALASVPFPANLVAAALTGIQGGLQIAAIASQAPPKMKKGGRLKGPKHEDGGIPMVYKPTGEIMAEAEGGELVLPEATDKANQPVTDILLRAGGNNVMDQIANAVLPQINYARSIQSTELVNSPAVVSATGSARTAQVAFESNTSSSGSEDSRILEALSTNTQEMKAVREALEKMPKTLKAIVVLGELTDSQNELDLIERLAAFDQRSNDLNV